MIHRVFKMDCHTLKARVKPGFGYMSIVMEPAQSSLR